jgi:hypothetical protein
MQVPFADDIRYPVVDECQSVVDIEGKVFFSLVLAHCLGRVTLDDTIPGRSAVR